ncbi:hypothetical protein FLACHUCJ7_03421 [Flavobacterium chungangense]|uniref:Uncharacterized protein n=1 Tax=Flavobacterium chungangense TaxID=554283 RepID=A0A6V6Z848_9FLAO|nr:hypothetical protein FLACHUCJ7_03421 [Flavobacterium chungangense]
MDIYKVIYRILLAVVIIYPNYIFFKGLKNSKKKHYKYNLLYFLASIVTPCSIIFLIALVMTSPAFNHLTDIELDLQNLTTRIIVGSIIFLPSILVNICFAKLYLKRISKIKNKNEIELIGSE